MRLGPIMAAAVLSLLLGAPARADSGGVARQPDDAVAKAKEHFEHGMKAFAAHDYRQAIQEFEAALGRAPSVELWFDLARAHEELAEYDKACAAYERYLRDSVDAKDAEAVRARIARLQELDAQTRAARRRSADTGDLRIRSSVDAALVMLDGRLVGRAPLEASLALQPGSYRLDVTQPGYVPFRAQVQVEPGMLTAAYADLSPLTSASAPRASRVWTWVALSGTAALLVTSAALGAMSIARQGDGHPHQAARSMDGADVTFGGAALCALATTVLYFAEGANRRGEHAREVAPLAKRGAPR